MPAPLLLLYTIGCNPGPHGDSRTADDSATGSTRVSVEVVTVHGPVTCTEPEAREQQGPFRAWTSEAWEAQPVNRTEGGFDDYSGWGVSVAGTGPQPGGYWPRNGRRGRRPRRRWRP